MYIKLITNKDNQFLTFCQSQLKKKTVQEKSRNFRLARYRICDVSEQTDILLIVETKL